ncbi:unnamed protein product [Owenia fusiformis]|uniref:Uncharacterized protein n=1 Tax=Owenia fusiformis TaxID=6347 RepID=A0A8S4PI51_OWEFU|nr:unnamed protein product [Owenia fusiformis]
MFRANGSFLLMRRDEQRRIISRYVECLDDAFREWRNISYATPDQESFVNVNWQNFREKTTEANEYPYILDITMHVQPMLMTVCRTREGKKYHCLEFIRKLKRIKGQLASQVGGCYAMGEGLRFDGKIDPTADMIPVTNYPMEDYPASKRGIGRSSGSQLQVTIPDDVYEYVGRSLKEKLSRRAAKYKELEQWEIERNSPSQRLKQTPSQKLNNHVVDESYHKGGKENQNKLLGGFAVDRPEVLRSSTNYSNANWHASGDIIYAPVIHEHYEKYERRTSENAIADPDNKISQQVKIGNDDVSPKHTNISHGEVPVADDTKESPVSKETKETVIKDVQLKIEIVAPPKETEGNSCSTRLLYDLFGKQEERIQSQLDDLQNELKKMRSDLIAPPPSKINDTNELLQLAKDTIFEQKELNYLIIDECREMKRGHDEDILEAKKDSLEASKKIVEAENKRLEKMREELEEESSKAKSDRTNLEFEKKSVEMKKVFLTSSDEMNKMDEAKVKENKIKLAKLRNEQRQHEEDFEEINRRRELELEKKAREIDAQFSEKEMEFIKKDHEIGMKELEMKKRFQDINAEENEFKKKWRDVNAREIQFNTKGHEMNSKELEFKKKDLEIEAKEKDLKQQQIQLENDKHEFEKMKDLVVTTPLKPIAKKSVSFGSMNPNDSESDDLKTYGSDEEDEVTDIKLDDEFDNIFKIARNKKEPLDKKLLNKKERKIQKVSKEEERKRKEKALFYAEDESVESKEKQNDEEEEQLMEKQNAEEERKLIEKQNAKEEQKLIDKQNAEKERKLNEKQKADEERKLKEKQKAEEEQKYIEKLKAEEVQKLKEIQELEEKNKAEAERKKVEEEKRKADERRRLIDEEVRRKIDERVKKEEAKKLAIEKQEAEKEKRKLEENQQKWEAETRKKREQDRQTRLEETKQKLLEKEKAKQEEIDQLRKQKEEVEQKRLSKEAEIKKMEEEERRERGKVLALEIEKMRNANKQRQEEMKQQAEQEKKEIEKKRLEKQRRKNQEAKEEEERRQLALREEMRRADEERERQDQLKKQEEKRIQEKKLEEEEKKKLKELERERALEVYEEEAMKEEQNERTKEVEAEKLNEEIAQLSKQAKINDPALKDFGVPRKAAFKPGPLKFFPEEDDPIENNPIFKDVPRKPSFVPGPLIDFIEDSSSDDNVAGLLSKGRHTEIAPMSSVKLTPLGLNPNPDSISSLMTKGKNTSTEPTGTCGTTTFIKKKKKQKKNKNKFPVDGGSRSQRDTSHLDGSVFHNESNIMMQHGPSSGGIQPKMSTYGNVNSTKFGPLQTTPQMANGSYVDDDLLESEESGEGIEFGLPRPGQNPERIGLGLPRSGQNPERIGLGLSHPGQSSQRLGPVPHKSANQAKTGLEKTPSDPIEDKPKTIKVGKNQFKLTDPKGKKFSPALGAVGGVPRGRSVPGSGTNVGLRPHTKLLNRRGQKVEKEPEKPRRPNPEDLPPGVVTFAQLHPSVQKQILIGKNPREQLKIMHEETFDAKNPLNLQPEEPIERPLQFEDLSQAEQQLQVKGIVEMMLGEDFYNANTAMKDNIVQQICGNFGIPKDVLLAEYRATMAEIRRAQARERTWATETNMSFPNMNRSYHNRNESDSPLSIEHKDDLTTSQRSASPMFVKPTLNVPEPLTPIQQMIMSANNNNSNNLNKRGLLEVTKVFGHEEINLARKTQSLNKNTKEKTKETKPSKTIKQGFKKIGKSIKKKLMNIVDSVKRVIGQ